MTWSVIKLILVFSIVLINNFLIGQNYVFSKLSFGDTIYRNISDRWDYSNKNINFLIHIDQTNFDSAISFENSTLYNNVYFSNCSFRSKVNFINTKFEPIKTVNSNHITDPYAFFIKVNFLNDVDFEKAEFQCRAIFNNSMFNRKANFQYTKFNSSAEFSNISFIRGAFFNNADFNSTCSFSISNFFLDSDFQYINFESSVNFIGSLFYSDAKFSYSKFNSLANFAQAVFDSSVFFNGSLFDSTVTFARCQFNDWVSFKDATFNNAVSFEKTILPKWLDFSNASIKTEIDLTKAHLNDKYDSCYIGLTNTDIEKIRFRYSRIKFFTEEGTDKEIISNIFERLLEKTKKEGFIFSYELLDKRYKKFIYTESGKYNRILGVFLNWISKNWWGYGYDKVLIIRNSIILFFLFSLINTFLFKHLITKVYVIEKIKEWRMSKNGSRIIMFFNVMPYSFFYTALIFFGLKFDLDKLKYQDNLKWFKVFNLVYFFVVYITGLICLGYLANFIIST
ncbi:pentapeptide repeat-containing protein [bacterium]|nr:pentapeptide repeat-containing protein [bacterium]